jgi:phage tail-like protein
MSVLRDEPYGRCNFLVALGGGAEPASVVAGFAEVSGLGLEVQYAEYRNGNDRQGTVRKVPGLHRVHDVTLKRGVIGSTDLFEWLRRVADGVPDPRDVTITLLDQAREPVLEFRLLRAQPRRWSGPSLDATSGTSVAMEELVLTAEGLRLE